MTPLTLIHRSQRSKLDLDEHRPEGKQVSPMRLVLKIAQTNQIISIPLADRLVVGRGEDGHQPDIDLKQIDGFSYGISRWHAAFSYDRDLLSIEDLNSTNGTRINGYRIDTGKPYHLRNGDELELGFLRLIVGMVRPRG